MSVPKSRAAPVRIAPFAVFMLVLAVRGALPDGNALGLDQRWIYLLAVLLVGGLLCWFWREYGELALTSLPTLSEVVLAAVVGLAVFWLWAVLDAPWMQLEPPSASFVPVDANGRLQWLLIIIRWVGAALVVPVMEELFWRSFLMRWLENRHFQSVDPRRVGLRAVVLSTVIFTLAHTLWLAASLAGLAYAWLYLRTGKLWVSVIAHAVTNGVLGVWVVTNKAWAFW
ncbi:MAG: CAAX prenyl protease-related protein [Burkholderiaceae bacterium]|nr:CAAX prenyl protease-related protein [Burkholderiaceae bacterium]MDH3460493.1 CAAX prenyl protease-related protein [Burkholderiaceae bacterium]